MGSTLLSFKHGDYLQKQEQQNTTTTRLGWFVSDVQFSPKKLKATLHISKKTNRRQLNKNFWLTDQSPWYYWDKVLLCGSIQCRTHPPFVSSIKITETYPDRHSHHCMKRTFRFCGWDAWLSSFWDIMLSPS